MVNELLVDSLYENVIRSLSALKPLIMEDFHSIYEDELRVTVYVQCLNENIFSLRIRSPSATLDFRGTMEDIKFSLRGKIRQATSYEALPKDSNINADDSILSINNIPITIEVKS